MRYLGESLECETAGERDSATVDMMTAGDTGEHAGTKTVMTALPLANFIFEAREMGGLYQNSMHTLYLQQVATYWFGCPNRAPGMLCYLSMLGLVFVMMEEGANKLSAQ